MKILIAEDDPNTNKLYKIGFKNDEIKICIDGQEFIDNCSGDYDIFILDLRLPIRSGFEIIKLLNKVHCKIPVVIVTALSPGDVQGRVNGELVYRS